ncbi:MAG: ABC transporter substrate-binding protein [Actinomycetota bacterium]
MYTAKINIFKRKKWIGLASATILATTIISGNIATQASSPNPSRIISLSPSATEILYGIGAGPQVIAVDDNSDYPSNAPFTKLSSYTPNVEAIAAYHPDLVVLQSSATGAAAVESNLQKLKINVFLEVTPNNITEAYAEYLALGKATGHPSRAKALVTTMKSQIAEILAKAKKSSSVPFYHELDNTLYSAASSTFIGQIYSDFGLTNIADAANTADAGGYPQLTSEYVVKANPKAIFLDEAVYGESLATVAARPGWSGIDAVKNKHVISLPLDIPDRWGPRLVNFYRFIAAAIAKIN